MLSRKLRCRDQRFMFRNLIMAFVIRLHSIAKRPCRIHIAGPHRSQKILPPEILMFRKYISKPFEGKKSIAVPVRHGCREPLAQGFLLVLLRVLRPQSSLGFLLQKKSGSE